MADNAFAGAIAALQNAQEEYNRLGKANVRMRASRTTIHASMDRQREQSREKIATADAELEAKIDVMRGQHAVDRYQLAQECEATCSKLRERRDELSGLIEDNEIRRQELMTNTATPAPQRRASRASLAAHWPDSSGETTLSNADVDIEHEYHAGTTNGDDNPGIDLDECIENASVKSEATATDVESHSEDQDDYDMDGNVEDMDEEPDTIVVSTTARATRSTLSSTQQDHIDADPADAWIHQAPPIVAPSRSRTVALGRVFDYLPGPLPDYANPGEEDSFSPGFPLVIYLDGRWHALHCYQCRANCPNRSKDGYFNGIPSLLKHMSSAHRLIPSTLQQCIDRTFDNVDVQRLEQGLQPLSGPIQEVRYNKRARDISDV